MTSFERVGAEQCQTTLTCLLTNVITVLNLGFISTSLVEHPNFVFVNMSIHLGPKDRKEISASTIFFCFTTLNVFLASICFKKER